MEMMWLEDFLALADSRSFSRAAIARGVTQPAFSRRIKALETWLGVTLVDRDTHRLALTVPGARFVDIAASLLRTLELGRLELQGMAEEARSSVRFAATHALSLTYFPQLIHALQQRHQREISIQLTADNMEAAEQLMIAGKVQFLLCHHHPAAATRLDRKGFITVTLALDELVPVSAPGDDGRALHSLPGSTAKRVDYLCYGGESGIGRIVAAAREDAGPLAHLTPVFTSHAAMVIAAMARDRRGMAWLPLSLVQADLAAGALVVAGGAEWNIPIEVQLCRSKARQSPAAETFWSLLVEQSVGDQPFKIAQPN
jgi:LysR family transcriptional regulator, hypochlorite-specific transcription factor HypT